MRHVFRSLLAGAAVLAAGLSAASAADLGHGSLKDYGAPMPVTMSSPSSWYIRGDFSASSFDVPTIYEHDATSEYDLTQNKIGRNWGLGGGIGRYLGANTRADLTFDWFRKSSVSGFMSPIIDDGSNPLTPCGAALLTGCATNLAGEHKFDLQSTVGLLNFYYDFGQRGHFSPYVGAGIGFVRHKTSNGTINGKSTTQLAGALMTGFSVALRSNMHLDAGYRFLYMGKAETGSVRGTSSDLATVIAANPVYDDPTVTDIHAHQFRVGVRYDFGGASTCGQRC